MQRRLSGDVVQQRTTERRPQTLIEDSLALTSVRHYCCYYLTICCEKTDLDTVGEKNNSLKLNWCWHLIGRCEHQFCSHCLPRSELNILLLLLIVIIIIICELFSLAINELGFVKLSSKNSRWLRRSEWAAALLTLSSDSYLSLSLFSLNCSSRFPASFSEMVLSFC